MQLFHLGSPLWFLGLWSILTGVAMLIVFRYTSNQAGIRRVKNRIKAHLLELRLFKDDLATIMAAQKHILLQSARYMAYALKPMLVMGIPIALLLMHLDGWFGYRSLQPGETVLVKVRVADRTALDTLILDAGSGLIVETPPLRIPEINEATWRLRASEQGTHTISVEVAGQRLDKQVMVAQGLFRISLSRLSSKFWQILLHPNEPPLPQSSGLQRIEVSYPTQLISIFHWNVHWLVCFFVLSMVVAFALKPLFRVEI